MPERRKTPRTKVYFGGVQAFNDRSSTLDCIVHDFSACGARLDMPSTALIPDRLALIVRRKGQEFGARVAWRGTEATGLEFTQTRDASSVIPFAAARGRRRPPFDEGENR
jgi:hypothetical protein